MEQLDSLKTVKPSQVYVDKVKEIQRRSQELNLKEIGAVLSLTESRICQLHSQAIMRLPAKMKQHQ